MIWKQEFTIDGLNQFMTNTMGETLGIKITDYGPDYLKASMPVDHRTKQVVGLLHGGASVTLAETLGSIGSVLCLPDIQSHTAVGLEINANHIRPATSGSVHGTAKPVRLGRQVHVWNIEIRDDEERLICVSRLTTMIIPATRDE